MTSPRLAYEQVARSIGRMGNCRNSRCCGAKALDSDDSSRLNGGPGSAEPFSGAFATMMTASSGKIHPAFTSQSTSGPSAPLILSQPILVRSVCKGAAGAFGAPGISPMIRIRRRNRLRISAGGEAGQLPSHPLRRIGRRVAIQWVQRNIQVWAWTTVVLAIKAAADLDQHKLANGLTLQQSQRKAEHLLDRNSITFDRRKVDVDAR
jgi:hypothetical protein